MNFSQAVNSFIEVNFWKKLLFLHQLTHNMATNFSWIYEFSAWKFQDQNMFHEQFVVILWVSWYKDLLVIQARHHKVFGFNVLCNTVVLGCIALAAVVYGTITYISTYAYLSTWCYRLAFCHFISSAIGSILLTLLT